MADIQKEKRKPEESYVQALLLAEVVKRILSKKAEIRLSVHPEISQKPIIEFRKRMRVSSLGKLAVKTYISVIHFYQNGIELDESKVLGTLVVFIPEDFITILFKALEYPPLEDDDEVGLEDACGTFCNLVAGNFKSGLIQLGYDELVMSHFSNYQNEVVDGVAFPHLEQKYYEINFEVRDRKSIVINLIMGKVPKLY